MQIAKTIFGAFGFGAVALLFWRPAGNLAVCSDSNDTPPPVSYKIEFGEKSFWAVHSHITRLEPADNEFAAREQTFRVAKNIGINFVRTGFIWRDIQPEPNRWQWTKFDSVVLSARRQRVHLLGLVHTPPQWAFPAHEHLNEWTVFLDSVVTRYGDYITDWEIWNEPNIDKFWPTRAPIEGYFELVKRSHQLIKQRKPRATVLLGGMANQPSAFVMWEKLMALGVADFCDGLAYHPYGVVGEELVPILQRIRGIVAAHSSSPKPVWITEYGWSSWRHPLHPARSNSFAQVLQYCFQQELKINRPANILVLDDMFSAAMETCDLYEPLRQQFEAFGWRADLIEVNALLKFLQTTTQPTRENIVVVPTNKLPAELVQPLINFIQRGGSVVMLSGVPFPNNAARLNVKWTSGQNEDDAPKFVNRIPAPVNLPANAPAKNFLLDPAAAAEVRYVPLLSASQAGKPLGEVAALFDYHGQKKGALVAFTTSLTIRSNRHSVTYHEHATDILKTALVYLLEGGAHFFVYEFRDQQAQTNDKYYGLVENDFRLKDAAQAVFWLGQQLGKGAVVRSKNYFSSGVLIEMESLDGARYVITWGAEAMTRFKNNFMSKGRYTPETCHHFSVEQLLAGLERQQEGALANVIIWRAAN